MPANAKNFADAVIATAPSPATSGLSLTVATGYGARFSAASFNVAIGPGNVRPSLETHELATVSTRTGDVFTLSARGIESTNPRAIVAGDVISQLPTAADWLDLVAQPDSPTWTGNHLWQQSLAYATTSAAQRLVNPAAAAVNTGGAGGNKQRFSPATQWEAFGWDSSFAVSRSVRFATFAQPVQSTGLTDSGLLTQSSINNAAWADCFFVSPNLSRFYTNLKVDYDLTVGGAFNAVSIEGLFNIKLKELSDPTYKNTILFNSSVAPDDDRSLTLDLQNRSSTLSIGADWTLGDYTAGAPTPSGFVTVIINSVTYKIAAELVP
jgi:hypothetical protein